MVLHHMQEANTLVNRQNIRYNILSGTLVPYRAINRHISTKQDLPRCYLCGFAVDICERYVVLFNLKIFKKGDSPWKNCLQKSENLLQQKSTKLTTSNT